MMRLSARDCSGCYFLLARPVDLSGAIKALPGGTLIILAAVSIYITFYQLNKDILDFES